MSRLSLKNSGFVGLNTNNPRAWQEIMYCPPLNITQAGFIVTKNLCNINSETVNVNEPDLIGLGISFVGGGSGGEGNNSFTLPFNFLTGNLTNSLNPLYNTEAPLFWLRTENPVILTGGIPGGNFDTKMIVMPDGSVGINIAQPRAALDVRGSQAPNRPAAIFGSRALGTGGYTGPSGLFQYYTQQFHLVPILTENGYNKISRANDQGLFFSDGKGLDGSNLNGALVLASWSNSIDTIVSGIRIDSKGNVGIGVSLTNNNKLAVNGNMSINGSILCKNEFKVVDIAIGLADYIFENCTNSSKVFHLLCWNWIYI